VISDSRNYPPQRDKAIIQCQANERLRVHRRHRRRLRGHYSYAASTVIFAELNWVPGNLAQAEARAHRIGQRDSVLVQLLVLNDSLEARMAELVLAKMDIIRATSMNCCSGNALGQYPIGDDENAIAQEFCARSI
jgi:hypothetical protein